MIKTKLASLTVLLFSTGICIAQSRLTDNETHFYVNRIPDKEVTVQLTGAKGSQDADNLILIEPAPTTIRGARNLLSVAIQYGNAFGQGMQAAALKAADFFGNDNILYLMEDMATGEIRLSILWEWVHKGAKLTKDDPETGMKVGNIFSAPLFNRLLNEEYEKLLKASNKDVYDESKTSTLPISREIADTYIHSIIKLPWFIDLLNINLNNTGLEEAKGRIKMYVDAFKKNGSRITKNLDFISP